MDNVIAIIALDVIVAAQVGDDVVAGAAIETVYAVTALDAVIPAIPPDRVVAYAGDQDVGLVRATQHHMVFAGVAQVVGVGARGCRVVADHQRNKHVIAQRVFIGRRDIVGAFIHKRGGVITQDAVSTGVVDNTRIELLGLVHFQNQARGGENVSRQTSNVSIGHHHLGEGVLLHLGEEVQPGQAPEIVEAVAVLQRLHLGFKHEVEGRAEQATERHLLLGQAANPEIDQVEAGFGCGPGVGAVKEIEPVCRNVGAGAEHDRHCRSTLGFQCRGTGDGCMGAVRGDEIDQGSLMLEVAHEVHPTGIGFQLSIAGQFEELAACGVEGRNTGIPATGDIDGGQVQRKPQQVIAQRLGDELIDLVALLARHAADDRAGRLIRGRAAGSELQRIEECRDQADFAAGEVRVEAVDGFGQHRVTEAIHHVGELGEDCRVDRGVIPAGRKEFVDLRLNGPRELLEHQVLVLHLGAELGGLEQALAIPLQGVDPGLISRYGTYRS
ncbi:hypothetical protein D3C85_871830 [compost metagenome]